MSERKVFMETHFHQELEKLKGNLLVMATWVEEAINNAVQSLARRDPLLVQKVSEAEDRINTMDIAINIECLNLLALKQPMAADLRFITSALKIITDLERMGDQAANIAERALSLNREPQLKLFLDIPRMAQIAQSMAKDALDAFVNQDSRLARSVCERDDQVDGLNEQVVKELLNYMISDTDTISQQVHLLIVARCLEKIADHATNIAEHVIFMVDGLVIKHRADTEKRDSGNSL